jgi:hypothetical protein
MTSRLNDAGLLQYSLDLLLDLPGYGLGRLQLAASSGQGLY